MAPALTFDNTGTLRVMFNFMRENRHMSPVEYDACVRKCRELHFSFKGNRTSRVEESWGVHDKETNNDQRLLTSGPDPCCFSLPSYSSSKVLSNQ